MTLADALLAVIWGSVTLYALLAGADFGGGIWDLLAGGSRRGSRPRALIEHAIGPVWEANHVWLIFVLVLMWTLYPPLFAAISSTLYLPLTFVALGVIGRGSAFAFRKAVSTVGQRRLFGAVFATSSVVTPFFLGAAAGAVASGRVPPGLARGDAIGSWVNPTSAVSGVFAVAACAWLAAVYLTADARRSGSSPDLVAYFRRRALAAGTVMGVLSVVGLAVLRNDAPLLSQRITGGWALALVSLAALAGSLSLALVWRRCFAAARVSAAAAVAAVLWAWGVAQYPDVLLPGLTVRAAAAPHGTLVVTGVCVAVGVGVLVPSLAWLFLLFQGPPPAGGAPVVDVGRGVDGPGRR